MTDRLIAAFGWTLFAGVCLTIFGLVCGTPYLRIGALVCFGGQSGRCAPPVMCTYVGLQGRRHLDFEDATECPAIAFLPPRDGRAGARF